MPTRGISNFLVAKRYFVKCRFAMLVIWFNSLLTRAVTTGGNGSVSWHSNTSLLRAQYTDSGHALPASYFTRPIPDEIIGANDTFISIQSSKAILYNFCVSCFFLIHVVVGASKVYEEYNVMCAILPIWHCVSGSISGQRL
jgi:hypothetical protein